MAEITKPIALDESFNTTEGSPRNVADVLAQGIGDLVTVVSRISHQTTYDELSDLKDVNISAPTNGDVLTYDGSKWVNGQVGGGSAEQMIAPVETSTTASQAYAIGEQFILNGTLYTATAAITLGGTIVIDGNCTASDTVTEQIHEEQFNVTGAAVSLLGYTTLSDAYKFPYDGYCAINATSAGAYARLRLADANGTNMAILKASNESTDGRNSVFVRKGMKAYVDQQNGTLSVYFYPLISYAE